MGSLYTMPVPPMKDSQAFDYYQQFVHEMNNSFEVHTGRRIQQSIERSAKKLHTSSAYMARVLVEYGLRAPKSVFPVDFVSHVQQQASSPVLKHFRLSGGIYELGTLWSSMVEQNNQVNVSEMA